MKRRTTTEGSWYELALLKLRAYRRPTQAMRRMFRSYSSHEMRKAVDLEISRFREAYDMLADEKEQAELRTRHVNQALSALESLDSAAATRH